MQRTHLQEEQDVRAMKSLPVGKANASEDAPGQEVPHVDGKQQAVLAPRPQARQGSDAKRLYALSDVTNAHSQQERRDQSDQADSLVEPPAQQVVQSSKAKEEKTRPLDASALEVVDIDAPYLGDSQLVPEYAEAISQFMREREPRNRPECCYIETVQRDMTAYMRSVLIDWIVEVADEYSVCTETLYLTVNYIDRFLSKRAVSRNNLQLVGVTCMRLAAKFEEIYPPELEKFTYITDQACTREDIIRAEREILEALAFELAVPTSKVFLQRFLRAAHQATRTEYRYLEALSRYILELSLMDYSMLAYLPSMAAASALFLARLMLANLPSDDPPVVLWTATLEHYAFYTALDLRPCVLQLHKLMAHAMLQDRLPAIHEKYSQRRWHHVARIAHLPSVDDAAFEAYASWHPQSTASDA